MSEQRSASPQPGVPAKSPSPTPTPAQKTTGWTQSNPRSGRMTWQPTTARATTAQPQGPLSQPHKKAFPSSPSPIIQTTHRYPQTPGTKPSAAPIDLTSDNDADDAFSTKGIVPHRAAPPPPVQKQHHHKQLEQTLSLTDLMSASSNTQPISLQKDASTHDAPSGDQGAEGEKVKDDAANDANSKNIVYNEDNTIKYASMEVLVDRMISGKGTDANFMNHFLLTMNLHTTPEAFLDVLTRHFRGDTEMAYKLRVFVVLKSWVEKLWNSSTDPHLIQSVRDFALNSGMDNPAKTLIKLIEQKVGDSSSSTQSSENTNTNSNNTATTQQQSSANAINSGSSGSGSSQQKDYIFAEEVPPPIVPVSYLLGVRAPPGEITLETVSVIELARQLALGEIELFKAIKPWEFQNLNFARKDKSLAPNIHNYSRHFNAMSKWASWRVLECSDLQKRVHALEKVIELAYFSAKLQNYNAVNEFVAACTSSAVFRLKKTWEGISPQHTAKFKELSELVAPAKSYAALRNKLHTIHPPCVPYIGIYQTDLTFIEEGNPTLNDGLVNWKKCRLQANIIIEIQTYQQSPYGYFPVPWIRDFFLNLQSSNDDDEMWKASITIEPKERKAAGNATNAAAAAAAGGAGGAGAGAGAGGSNSSGGAGGSPPEADISSKFFSASTLPGFKPKILGNENSSVVMETDVGESGGNGNAGGEDSITKTEIKVLLPGKSAFLHVSVREKLVKEPILRHAAENGLISYGDVADPAWLLMMFSDEMPFGVEQMDGSATPTSEHSFFMLCHDKQMVEVVYPAGFALGPMPPQMSFDYESPLFTLAYILKTIATFPNRYGGDDDAADEQQPATELLFMRLANPENPEFAWLNSNLSLKEQGFDVSHDRIVVVPIELLLRLEESSLRAQYPSKMSSTLPTKPTHSPTASAGSGSGSGGGSISTFVMSQMQLVKANARSMTRGGVLTKQMLTGASSSFRKGTMITDKEKRKYLLVDNFLFGFKESSPQAVPSRVWPLEFCNPTLGIVHNTQMCIALKYIPQHSRCAGASSNSRPRGVSNGAAANNNNNNNNNPGDPSENDALPQGSSAGATSAENAANVPDGAGGAAAAAAAGNGNGGDGTAEEDNETSIESGSEDVGRKEDKADTTLFMGSSDAMTRLWFETLAQRSRVNSRTRVFGEPIDAICRRDGTIAPWFLTDAVDLLIKKATRLETVLSAQPPAALLERYKDSINAGVCPAANDPVELACLAQCVLMFFTELPEPVIPLRMYAGIAAYCGENKSANLGALRAIVAKLPDFASNALFCLLMYFKLWADRTGNLRKAAVTIGQVIMSPHDAETPELLSPTSIIEIASHFGEDILNNFTKLNLRRLKADIAEHEANPCDDGGDSSSSSNNNNDGGDDDDDDGRDASEVATITLSQLQAKQEPHSNQVTVFSKKQLDAISASLKTYSPYVLPPSGTGAAASAQGGAQSLPSSPLVVSTSAASAAGASQSAAAGGSSGGEGDPSLPGQGGPLGAGSGSGKKGKSGLSFSARISQHFKRDRKTGNLKNTSHGGLGDSVVIIADSGAEEDGGSKPSKSEHSSPAQTRDGANGGVRKKSNSSGGKSKDKK